MGLRKTTFPGGREGTASVLGDLKGVKKNLINYGIAETTRLRNGLLAKI